jgi:hypothetical protein
VNTIKARFTAGKCHDKNTRRNTETTLFLVPWGITATNRIISNNFSRNRTSNVGVTAVPVNVIFVDNNVVKTSQINLIEQVSVLVLNHFKQYLRNESHYKPLRCTTLW